MMSLKSIDRIALAAMFSVILGVPLAVHASFLPGRGAPDAKVTLRDGVERRFYTSGPAGTTTYRVDVSPEGKVLSSRQVLSDDVFFTIRRGMPASEVLDLIGPPYQKTRFESTKTTAWDYHYRDTWGYDADFSVLVDDAGSVAGTIMIRTGNG